MHLGYPWGGQPETHVRLGFQGAMDVQRAFSGAGAVRAATAKRRSTMTEPATANPVTPGPGRGPHAFGQRRHHHSAAAEHRPAQHRAVARSARRVVDTPSAATAASTGAKAGNTTSDAPA